MLCCFAKKWWCSPFWLSPSPLPMLPRLRTCASPFLFPEVAQDLLDLMLITLWVISPGGELSRPTDLKDVIAADNSTLLQIGSFLSHPPCHGFFFQTGTREVSQGFLSHGPRSCWTHPVTSLVLAWCSFSMYKIFIKNASEPWAWIFKSPSQTVMSHQGSVE